MSATKTVILASPYTGADGKEHEVNADLELPRAEANRLLFAGLAREPKAPVSDRIEDILEAVGADVEKAKAALEAEKAGKNRTTLVSKLEAIVNTNPEGN